MIQKRYDRMFNRKVLFSDAATFTTNGVFNKQNNRETFSFAHSIQNVNFY